MNEKKQTGVILKVDEKIIPLNHFVENVFANVIQGLVDSLDKIPPNPKKIEVTIEKE